MKDIKAILSVVVLIILSLLVVVPMTSAETINIHKENYPSSFDGEGMIYRVSEKGIVVDGIFVFFAPQVKFMTPRSKHSNLRSFKPGQIVGYYLDEENQITNLFLSFRTRN